MAEKLNAYGIKVDWVITNNIDGDIQSDVKLLQVNNEPLIASTLKHLTDNNYPAVNVVTDDLDLDDYLPFIDKINLVIFYNKQKNYPAASSFSKWKPAGEIVELLSTPTNLQFTGLDKLSETTFKTRQDGFFTLQFDDPFVVVAEAL
jgi:thiamine pyrophosphokinase